jgi:hypothetical protein
VNNALIFLGGFGLSLAGYGLLAYSVWWSSLSGLSNGKVETLLHTPSDIWVCWFSFRRLSESVTKTAFATMLVYGYAVVEPLALVSMGLWVSGSRLAKPCTWVFSVVASLDLLNAIYGAFTLAIAPKPANRAS